MSNSKITVKFPIRARAEKFLKVLKQYKDYCNEPDNIQMLISIDEDDTAMTDEIINEMYKVFKNTTVVKNEPKGKIAACNANLDLIDKDTQIIVLASDDMIPQIDGWDFILQSEMQRYYPDTDGVLFHNEGYLQEKLNCMVIVGRRYFERFGYLYNPEYISLWCDNEFQDVANRLGKQTYFPLVLFKHEHYSRNKEVQMDELMRHNESFFNIDKETYKRRKANNFDLK